MKQKLPVYAITDFETLTNQGHIYANRLSTHVAQHQFTRFPHKHDFYLTALFTRGKGRHEIDFTTHIVKPGTLFILKPGQMHYWWLSDDVDGFVFFHTKEFYEAGFTHERLANYNFLKPLGNRDCFILKPQPLAQLKQLMEEIYLEYEGENLMKMQKIHALINLCYISVARLDSSMNVSKQGSNIYRDKAEQFEELLNKNFNTEKSAGEYAQRLNITEKHLNRIIKTCLGKTTTQLISERVVLEAKRMLVQAKYNVEEIGAELGYPDKSYFTRFFKKNSGETPTAFLKRYK